MNSNSNYLVYDLFFHSIREKDECFDYITNERHLSASQYSKCFKSITYKFEYNHAIKLLKKSFDEKTIQNSGIYAFYFFASQNIPFIITAFYDDDIITYLWARRIDSSDHPKTFNLKGIKPPIFNQNCLKGLNKNEKVFLCEGVFDTLIMESMGFHAIGLLGVHTYNNDLIDLLKPFNVTIAFDNDEAGNQSAQRLADIFWLNNKPVNKLHLPVGMDITDYYKSGGFHGK